MGSNTIKNVGNMNTFTITQSPTSRNLYLYPNGDLAGCTDFDNTGDSPNYACVDEHRGDCDFNSTYVSWDSDISGFDLYTIDDTEETGTINYVEVISKARIINPPLSGTRYYLILSPSGNCTDEYRSDNKGLTTAWKTHKQIWVNNPETDAAWTMNNINDTCIGTEVSVISDTQTGLTLTLRPNAAGDETNLSVHGAANNYQAVDEETPDYSGTYVYHGQSDKSYITDLYNIPDITIAGNITGITVYYLAKVLNGFGTTRAWSQIKTGGAVFTGTTHLLGTSWTLYSDTWATNPNTGLAWTQVDINNLQIGIKLYEDIGSGDASCTQLYAVVIYDESGSRVDTTQEYLRVNYTPPTQICTVPKPEGITYDYSRIENFINFWNGDREVYTYARRNKTLLLSGFIDSYDVSRITNEIFYFDSYITATWSNNVDNIVDGDDATYGYEDWFDSQELTHVSVTTDYEDECIRPSKVEVRIKYKMGGAMGVGGLDMQMTYPDGDGDIIELPDVAAGVQTWSEWYDITNDTNAPDIWTNDIVENLRVTLTPDSPLMCAYIIQIRVSKFINKSCCVIDCLRDMGRDGSTVTISDLYPTCFNGNFTIRSVGWKLLGLKPESYEYMLELESND